MDSFFGIGPLELVAILVLALIILGPERLPQAMREVVALLRKARELSDTLTQQVNTELGDLKELQALDPRREIQKVLMADPAPKTPPKKTALDKARADDRFSDPSAYPTPDAVTQPSGEA